MNTENCKISVEDVLKNFDSALNSNEFKIYFQPIVDVKTQQIATAEVLVRWDSPKYGMILPSDFISVLEQAGKLSEIDKFVERSAFDFHQSRISAGLYTVPLHINLSWKDFSDSKLIAQLRCHLESPSCQNKFLKIEITESTLAEMVDNRRELMQLLQDYKVNVVIDDFGQGYSFGTMKDVDFSVIKLDKTLIDKLGHSRKVDLLVDSFIGMFHKMDAKVVAEGVETEEQANYLRSIGCDYIQGFYYYQPMNEADFVHLLDEKQKEIQENTYNGKILEEDTKPDSVWVERDVLEKQNADLQRLVEESKCLRMLLDQQDIHYFEWDMRTHVDFVNDRFKAMYNMPTNEVQNMPEEAELCYPEDRERFRKFYYRAEAGEPVGFDYFRMINPDGKSYSWYRKTFYTLFDADHKPYKAIMTMQNFGEEFEFRAYKERNKLLVQQQEIITFIYTIEDDTFRYSVLDENGKVKKITIPLFLDSPELRSSENQNSLAELARNFLRNKNMPRTGYVDFMNHNNNVEMRAHYTAVDAEYGKLYALVGQAEPIEKTRERLNKTIQAQQNLINVTKSLQQIYNAFTYYDIKNDTTKIMVLDDCYKNALKKDMDWYTIADSYTHALLKPEHASAFKEFLDISTLDARMGSSKYLLLEYEDNALGWIRGYLIPSERDKNGHITGVIFASQPFGKEKSTMERLITLSETDGLTQIRNRFSGEREMKKVLSKREKGVFFILDCDKFKDVNDNFGHSVGDDLLIAIARAMQISNPMGINMRLGGDEFAFFVFGEHLDEEIHEHIKKLFNYIDNLKVKGMEDYKVSISVGGVRYNGQPNATFDDIYRDADALLYASKRFHGNKLMMQ